MWTVTTKTCKTFKKKFNFGRSLSAFAHRIKHVARCEWYSKTFNEFICTGEALTLSSTFLLASCATFLVKLSHPSSFLLPVSLGLGRIFRRFPNWPLLMLSISWYFVVSLFLCGSFWQNRPRYGPAGLRCVRIKHCLAVCILSRECYSVM